MINCFSHHSIEPSHSVSPQRHLHTGMLSVDLEDVMPVTYRAFLHYLYTGRIDFVPPLSSFSNSRNRRKAWIARHALDPDKDVRPCSAKSSITPIVWVSMSAYKA